MAKIPVGDTINYGYSFTFGNLLTLLGLTWLPLAVSAAVSYYVQTLWFTWMSKFPMFIKGGHPDPHAMMAMFADMSGYAGLGFLATLVTLFMSAVVGVAIVSQALGMRSGQTFVHIAAGPPEWRVFGGYIRFFLAIIAVVIICALGIGIAAAIGAMMRSSDGGGAIGAIIATVLGIVLFCLAILTIVRMAYLLVPSIVAEPGKGGLARSYHLTGGNFWRIFVVSVVLVLPVLIVAGAIQSAIIGNSFMGPFTQMLQQAQHGPMSSEQMQAVFAQMMENFRANFLPMAIINFVSSFFIGALTLSGASFAYRALTGAEAPAPAPAAV